MERVGFIEVATSLYKMGAIKLDGTELTNQGSSPFYIDAGIARSFPDEIDILARTYCRMIDALPVKPDFLANIPEGTTPLAAIVMHQTRIRLLTPDIKAKEPKIIGGGYKPGDRIAVLEDVVTTGGSVIKGIDLLEANGLVVTDVISLIDRQEKKGRERIQERVPNFHYFCSAKELLVFYLQHQMITPKEFQAGWQYFQLNNT